LPRPNSLQWGRREISNGKKAEQRMTCIPAMVRMKPDHSRKRCDVEGLGIAWGGMVIGLVRFFATALASGVRPMLLRHRKRRHGDGEMKFGCVVLSVFHQYRLLCSSTLARFGTNCFAGTITFRVLAKFNIACQHETSPDCRLKSTSDSLLDLF
jgi:hypothetical protein